MQITDLLAQLGGIPSMARELGVSEQQAQRGAEALAPAILGGFKKQTQAGGMEGLGGLLGQLGGGSLFDQVLSPEPTDLGRGNAVLGQIFGSKDVSRTVARNAAAQSGLDPALLQKMLPMLAMLVTGVLSRQGAGGDATAAPGAAQPSGGGLGDLLGGLLGGVSGVGSGGTRAAPGGASPGGLASMLDLNGDGNALDDILRMAGKALR